MVSKRISLPTRSSQRSLPTPSLASATSMSPTSSSSPSTAAVSSALIARCFYPSLSVAMKINIFIVIFGCFFMSANAIRCYQCNSHDDDSCAGLDSLKAAKTGAFLDDCPTNEDGVTPFCRKIAFTIEYNENNRIVRSCGYTPHSEHLYNRTDRCITADNEGYLEQVCQCFHDGCNSAPAIQHQSKLGLLSFLLGTILIFGLISNRSYWM